MSTPNSLERLTEARIALGGEERQKKIAAETANLNIRRQEAIRILEGSERSTAKTKAETALRIATEIEAKQKAEIARLKHETEQVAAAKIEALAQARAERKQKFSESQTTIKKIKNTPINLSAVRTLKTDLTEAANSEKISLTRIAIASEEKGRQMVATKERGRRRSTWLLFLILILVASGGVAYFFGYINFLPDSLVDPIATVTPVRKSLIFSEKYKKIDVTNMGPRELKRRLEEEISASEPDDEILELAFIKESQPINFRLWQEGLELGRSENFLSAITPKFMFGIYGTNLPTTFIALEPTNYERAFAGMLNWEKTMASDLAPILGGPKIGNLPREIKFVDRVIKNVDVRVLTTPEEEIIIYGFFNRDLLIIARDSKTFGEVTDRYRNAGQ